jgi:glucan phosphoethanolaminetransferase (alkaline phosphatase superfamily)
MGEIIFWGILRTAIIIPLLWIAEPYIAYSTWWFASIALLYAVILHPAIIQYRLFIEKNKRVLESSLCSSCRYFDRSAILCLSHDEHPTSAFLPCDGFDWEPKNVSTIEEYSEDR